MSGDDEQGETGIKDSDECGMVSWRPKTDRNKEEKRPKVDSKCRGCYWLEAVEQQSENGSRTKVEGMYQGPKVRELGEGKKIVVKKGVKDLIRS